MPTILLVDDDSDSLWLLQLILEDHGHSVFFARDGRAALLTMQQKLPDLIVTDWNMLRMDGIELCRRLEQHPALALIPVILSSGETRPVENTFLWTQFFPKPVDLEAMVAAIDFLVAKRLVDASSGTFRSPRLPCRRPAKPFKYWVRVSR